VSRNHCAQPQNREALRAPNLKVGNVRLRRRFHDAVDANRTSFVALHTESVQHVSGCKVVMRRLERRCVTRHALIVDPPIPYVHSLN